MKHGRYYHSLDIGTTKINSTIVEQEFEGKLRLVGIASAKSLGLRNSLIINIDKTTAAIIDVVERSQKMAGFNIDHAIVGIAGDHIQSINNQGMVSISKDRNTQEQANIITPNDIDRVLEDAQSIAMPVDRKIIHLIDQEYTVDGVGGIREPMGLTGRRLEVEVHLITGAKTAIRNLNTCLHNANLEVEDIVVESIASACGVLTEDERSDGVLMMDIGGGTVDYGVFKNNSVKLASQHKYAGSIVTKDIATMFKLPEKIAENLKLNYSNLKKPDNKSQDLIKIEILTEDEPFLIHPIDLNMVIRARMEEIFELTMRELRKHELLNELKSVVLTGGGSSLEGLPGLATEMFNIPARIGLPSGIEEMTDDLKNPSCATSVGLIHYAVNNSYMSHYKDDRKYFSRVKENIGSIINWLTN